jgi:hypothetical protein
MALCYWTAAVLAGCSVSVGLLRYRAMGQEAKIPPGPGNYHVTLLVRGHSQGDARLLTLAPLDVHHQHIYGEDYGSEQLYPKPHESKEGDKRHIVWVARPLVPAGPIEVRYEFLCTIDVRRPNASMARVQRLVHAAPDPGEWLHTDPGVDPTSPEIAAMALELTEGLENSIDQLPILFQYVDQNIRKEPAAGASSSAAACLVNRRGDALAKSRLLAALCRNRGIPARLVSGIILNKKSEQKPHVWVEAWVEGGWVSLCPYHHHYGKVPPNYLVFGFGDIALVRGMNITDLDFAYLVEGRPAQSNGRQAAGEQAAGEQAEREDRSARVTSLERFFSRISLYALPPAEARVVEFLLLLPIAALVICVFRNVLGLPSFGTFAPALIGLAFREDHAKGGMLVFLAVLLVGWCLRRALDRFHLLQVPRTAFMLSLIVLFLIALIMAANYRDIPATRYVSLFPMIILTGMIERFWTQETEEGTWTSFKTLLFTLTSAAAISLLVGFHPLVNHLVNYPETIGVVMAAQLLIGRYTGYRVSELFRFRDFIREPEVKMERARVLVAQEGGAWRVAGGEQEDEHSSSRATRHAPRASEER